LQKESRKKTGEGYNWAEVSQDREEGGVTLFSTILQESQCKTGNHHKDGNVLANGTLIWEMGVLAV